MSDITVIIMVVVWIGLDVLLAFLINNMTNTDAQASARKVFIAVNIGIIVSAIILWYFIGNIGVV